MTREPVELPPGFRFPFFFALATLLAAGTFLIVLPAGPLEVWGHIGLEAAGGALALTAAGLLLLRYRAERGAADLLLATAFLGMGILGLALPAAMVPAPARLVGAPLPELTAWAWVAPRIYLGLGLATVWLVTGRVTVNGGESDPLARGILIAGGIAGLVTGLLLIAGRLPTAFHPTGLLPRPWDLLPASLFALGVAGQLRRGGWREDPVRHALVLFMGLAALSHVLTAVLSSVPWDAASLAARVLWLGGLAGLVRGALLHVEAAYRRLGAASTAVMLANDALAREMEVRREAERVFGESEARLQDFLDHAHDLIQSTSPDGRILYVNEAWKQRLGYREEELEALTIDDVIHPDSLGGYRSAMARVFGGEALADLEVTFKASDGSAVHCSGSFNCRFEQGRPVATRSILRDVSEERSRERELAGFQANLRAVFESTGDAIWSVDRAYRLLTFNTAYALILEAVTGRSPEVGDPLEHLVAREVVGWFKGCYDRALAGDRFSATREERVDGQARSFELYFHPIESVGEGPTGVVVFSRDVTRRRRVEEALRRAKLEAEEANRTKSQFLANMSHELRTPLNSIIGFANILTRKGGPELEARERGFLERIVANGKHLLTLINEILDLSKIESGRMELQLESVDLRGLVHETVSQLEAQVVGRPVALRAEIEGDPTHLHTDRGRLKQVLINLVGNALKFTKEGEVVVRLETGGENGTPERIIVRDTGIGIPPDRLEAIFDAFQQADGGTARRFGGTGLGLTISRSLCRLLGYGLDVRSEVGEGSIFTIELRAGTERAIGERDEGPSLEALRSAGSAGAFDPLPPGLDLEGKKILVVDDEADSRALLSHYLEELGCMVLTAGDGVEGLEVARRAQPDLITVDLMMPRMSGWEMLRAAREDPALREIPVVVVSIVAEEGGGQVLGAVDLLTKPVEREDLARALVRNLVSGLGRALVVEDNPDHRALLQRYLREAGLTVETAGDGAEALDRLQRFPADLVVLDLVMPNMDGLSFLQRMRGSTRLAPIPVVVLTAKALEPAERDLLAGWGVRVIQKGADVELHLRSALDRYFGEGTLHPLG